MSEQIRNYQQFKQKYPHTFKVSQPPTLQDAREWYHNLGKRVEGNQKNESCLAIQYTDPQSA